MQLKAKLAKQKAAKDEHERRKNLTKYIPDVSRSLFSMLEIISDPTGVGAVAGSSAADTARDAAARAAPLGGILRLGGTRNSSEERNAHQLRGVLPHG